MENRNLSDWLSYEVNPSKLSIEPHPAMYGNGQVELLAELGRSCICDAACFGFGMEGLNYQKEEHLVPAVFDAETGRKYFLRSSPSSSLLDLNVTIRPDRHEWRYQFDDLEVKISLVLRRLQPGYLLKAELSPKPENMTKSWFLCHELRGYRGSMLFSKDAQSNLQNGTVWCRGEHGCWEAIASSCDAESINLGIDGDFAVDIMVKLRIQACDGAVAPVYLSRAFGDCEKSAKEGSKAVLKDSDNAEVDAERWWNDYLNDAPFLDVPDEDFSKSFLWSWPNFKANQIGLAADPIPAGMNYVNNMRLNVQAWINCIDNV